jgi:hypothetical protein
MIGIIVLTNLDAWIMGWRHVRTWLETGAMLSICDEKSSGQA